MGGGRGHIRMRKSRSLSMKEYGAVDAVRKLLTPPMLAAAIATVVTTTTAPAIRAAEPVLLVSASSIQGLLDDVAHITQVAGAAQAGNMAIMMARPFTAGLSKDRPVGVVVDETLAPLIFIPVDDFSTSMAVLKEQFGPPQQMANGVLVINTGGPSVYVKEQSGWAFVAQTAEQLANLPADPSPLLGRLPRQYDLAVRCFVQRIPQVYRDVAINQVKAGAEEAMRRKPDESDLEYEARRSMVESQIEQLTRFFTEIDQLTLGLRIDRSKNENAIDALITALPDTQSARQFEMLRSAESEFTPLVQGEAAFKFLMGGALIEEDREQLKMALANARRMAIDAIERSNDIPDADSRRLCADIVGTLFDAVSDTAAAGRVDAVTRVSLGGEGVEVVAAGHFVDPSKVEGAMTKALEALRAKMADGEPLNEEVSEHAGVRFRQITVPVPADENEARRIFGSAVKATLGIGKTNVFFTLGDRSMAQVKEFVAQETTRAPLKRPFQFVLSLAEILTFAQSIDSDNPQLQALGQLAGQIRGQDQVRIFVQPIERGAGYRVQVDSGVIQIIGASATQAANR